MKMIDKMNAQTNSPKVLSNSLALPETIVL
jgi:hypothetical protein